MGRLIILFLSGALVVVLLLDIVMIAFTFQMLQLIQEVTPAPIENQIIEYYEPCTDTEDGIYTPMQGIEIVSNK